MVKQSKATMADSSLSINKRSIAERHLVQEQHIKERVELPHQTNSVRNNKILMIRYGKVKNEIAVVSYMVV